MKAKISVDKNHAVGKIDNRIYGNFIEQMGRAVYGGIYEPTHPTADKNGFRQDVLELVKALEVPIVRYPGGNFVSGYNWEDGTGPKENRPSKLELAWHTVEPNQVGIDEFQQWAKDANTEVMMAVNLGTRGAEDAKNLVEYCNLDTPTYYAQMRKKNGFEKPFRIKTWCLGNEMDGPWQQGQKTALEYGRVAREAAKFMKLTDPTVELVLCGSYSFASPTFGEWERTALMEAYDYVDYISLHQYIRNKEEDFEYFMSRSLRLQKYIEAVIAICDEVKAKKKSKKTICLSVDEWNVWKTGMGVWPSWETGDPRLEEDYTFEDALAVATLLMAMQNRCDRVKMACMAQLVNVIAPIRTEDGGKAWTQTIYWPLYYASKYGRGETLRQSVATPTYDCAQAENVPYLQSTVIHNAEKREVVVFAVNGSEKEDMELTLAGLEDCTLAEHVELYSDDLKVINTAESQPVQPASVPVTDHVVLKKHSWNMLRYTY